MDDFALNVQEDSKKNIWAGCPGGVSRINGDKIRNWKLGKFDNFYRVFVDSYDRVWIYNFQFINDIYFIKNDSLNNFSQTYQFRNQRVLFMNEDDKGGIYFLTSEGRIYKTFSGAGKDISEINFEKIITPRMFFFNSDGDLILCGKEGMAKLSLNKNDGNTKLEWIFKESVMYGIESKSGYYWVATQNDGIYRINLTGEKDPFKRKMLHITEQNGLLTNNLFTLFEDNEQNIWIGTYLKGVCKLSSLRFVAYGKNEGFKAEAILSITQDGDELLCLTENGIYQFKENQFYKIEIIDSDNNAGELRTYLSILKLNPDQWLIGAARGLYLMDRNKKINSIGLSNLFVQTLLKDSKGSIWAGTNKGIYLLKDGKIPLEQDFETKNRYINKILEVQNKHLFVATDSGLVKIENALLPFEEKSIRYLTKENGLLANLINDITTDKSGDIIVGTGEGLNIISKDGIYSVIIGFHNRFIITLCVDDAGNLWVGTDNGLHLLKKIDGKYKVVAVFLQKDGLQSSEFTRNETIVEDLHGHIWIGTYGGLTVYTRKEEPTFLSKPKCYLSYFQVNDSTFHNPSANIYEFGYSQNKFSFYFEGLTYFDEDATKFEYYLEPLENPWSNSTSLPNVSYGYLEPGNYTFHVRAISPLGMLSNPQILVFTIQKPFWERIWFFIIVVAGILYSGYLITQNRLAHIKKRNQLLESLVNEKTAELRNSKDKLEEQYQDLLQAQKELVEKAELEKAYQEIQKLKNKLATENIYLKEKQNVVHEVSSVIGRSSAIQQIRKKIIEVANTDSNVLIIGETGTGKNLVAQAIHTLGSRKENTLITVNCAAIPDGLVESELFGHEKGAFTGANERRIGKFEIADSSTIFLDEIGDMNLGVQAKILNVLEDREITRVGGNFPIKIDVRLIAATNFNIEELITHKKFRGDLFYRLNTFQIELVPLRERIEDIELLAKYFIDKFAKPMNKKIEAITKEAFNILENYSFPGNVRELENIIQRAVIICNGNVITDEHIIIQSNSKFYPEVRNNLLSKSEKLEDIEKEHIIYVLESTNWRIQGKNGAAEILGIHPNTLRSRMLKLQIPYQKKSDH